MIIKRENIKGIINIINSFSNKIFNIKLQYKFIKIKKLLVDEEEILTQQIKDNVKNFIELDSNGKEIMNNDGGYKIKDECKEQCAIVLNNLFNMDISIPDIYLSLDELEELNLSLEQLELLMPFIKD